VRALLAAHAERAGARPVVTTADAWRVSDEHLSDAGTRFRLAHAGESAELWTPLAGRHQAANAATALALLDVMGPGYRVSLADAARWLPAVRLAGRLQRVGPWLFDVAHNPEGAAVLAGALAELAPARPVAALFCVLADKDWRSMMAALAPVVDRFVVTLAPTAPANRAWDAAEAAAFATAHGWTASCEPDFDRALAAARLDASTVVVTGSFHTVGDAMARLQVHPLAV
jgi:dihydrofolate synthase/folylpolyglutamate synthase